MRGKQRHRKKKKDLQDIANNKDTGTKTKVLKKSTHFNSSITSKENNQLIEKDVDYKREKSTRGREFGKRIFPQDKNYDQQEFDPHNRRNSGDRINAKHNQQMHGHCDKRGINDFRPNGAFLSTPNIPPLVELLSTSSPLVMHPLTFPCKNTVNQ